MGDSLVECQQVSGCKRIVEVEDCAAQQMRCSEQGGEATCVTGQCSDECFILGSTRCNGTRVEICTQEDCKVWRQQIDCAVNGQYCAELQTGATCSSECQDECTREGAIGCSPDGRSVVECVSDATSGCLVWRPEGTQCSSRQQCQESGGTAVCVCNDECDTEGARRCSTDNQGSPIVQQCYRDPADSCLAWVLYQLCPAGFSCDSGSATCYRPCSTDADCPAGYVCDTGAGQCTTNCTPNCTGRECGPDPVCGLSCGTCSVGFECISGQCRCVPDCTGKECGDDGCRGSCGTCQAGFVCNASGRCECVPNCTGKQCGPDGCGGSCGTCPAGQSCDTSGQCTGCTPDCSNRQCGPDPVCNVSCGTCPAGYTCDASGQCQCTPNCTGKECGPDGCGGSCGTCQAGYSCDSAGHCYLASGSLCPAGQECYDLNGTGGMGCVEPGPQIPAGNQTGCAGGTGCSGNFSCWCLDVDCLQSVCVENCGTCPAGTECCELWAGGPFGCLEPGCTAVPAGAPYCDQNIPCQGNAGCYTDNVTNFCIDHCSTIPCTDGTVRCAGDVVQTCQGGSWTNGTDCTASGQKCFNGQCMTPAGVGEFCENAPCQDGLDCIHTSTSQHSFCTPRCDCAAGTGCAAGWQCLFSDDPQNPTTCWCAKLCTTAADCPDGGAGGFACQQIATDGSGNPIYGCMIL